MSGKRLVGTCLRRGLGIARCPPPLLLWFALFASSSIRGTAKKSSRPKAYTPIPDQILSMESSSRPLKTLKKGCSDEKGLKIVNLPKEMRKSSGANPPFRLLAEAAPLLLSCRVNGRVGKKGARKGATKLAAAKIKVIKVKKTQKPQARSRNPHTNP